MFEYWTSFVFLLRFLGKKTPPLELNGHIFWVDIFCGFPKTKRDKERERDREDEKEREGLPVGEQMLSMPESSVEFPSFSAR